MCIQSKHLLLFTNVTDPSIFFQAKYERNVGDPTNFLLINLETLLPIKYDSTSNNFYADVYPQTLHPGIPVNDIKPQAESGTSNVSWVLSINTFYVKFYIGH